MTVYVFREGALRPKEESDRSAHARNRSDFPSPRVSRLVDFYESPVTGKEITSWRDRDRDMKAADAVDPRDLPPKQEMKRGRVAQFKEAKDARGKQPDDTFKWGGST